MLIAKNLEILDAVSGFVILADFQPQRLAANRPHS